MIIATILLLSIPFVIVLILFIISWSVHLQMTGDNNTQRGFATFAVFLKHFNNANMVYDNRFHSWFNRSNTSQVHASIIEFDNKGMMLDPISWFMFLIWHKVEDIKYAKKDIKKVKWD